MDARPPHVFRRPLPACHVPLVPLEGRRLAESLIWHEPKWVRIRVAAAPLHSPHTIERLGALAALLSHPNAAITGRSRRFHRAAYLVDGFRLLPKQLRTAGPCNTEALKDSLRTRSTHSLVGAQPALRLKL